MATKDYPYIRAWGQMMRSYQYFVDGEVEAARKAQAPQDAIYCSNGVWHRWSEMKDSNPNKAYVQHLVDEL